MLYDFKSDGKFQIHENRENSKNKISKNHATDLSYHDLNKLSILTFLLHEHFNSNSTHTVYVYKLANLSPRHFYINIMLLAHLTRT